METSKNWALFSALRLIKNENYVNIITRNQNHDLTSNTFINNATTMNDKFVERNKIEATCPRAFRDKKFPNKEGGEGFLWAAKKKFHTNFWKSSLDHVSAPRKVCWWVLSWFCRKHWLESRSLLFYHGFWSVWALRYWPKCDIWVVRQFLNGGPYIL